MLPTAGLLAAALASAAPDASLYDRAKDYAAHGDPRRAEALYRDGLGQAEADRDGREVVRWSDALAGLLEGQGRMEDAAAPRRRSVEAAESLQDAALQDAARVRLGLNDLARRPARFAQAEKGCGAVRERLLAASSKSFLPALDCLARSRYAQGDLELARFYREEGLSAEAPDAERVLNLIALAELREALGEEAASREALDQARETSLRAQRPDLEIQVEEAEAWRAVRAGDVDESRRLARASLADRARHDLPLGPAKVLMAAAALVGGLPEEAAAGFKEQGHLLGRGRALLAAERFKDAEEAYAAALQAGNSVDESAEANLGLAAARMALGKARAAAAAKKEAQRLIGGTEARLEKRHREAYEAGAAFFIRRSEAFR